MSLQGPGRLRVAAAFLLVPLLLFVPPASAQDDVLCVPAPGCLIHVTANEPCGANITSDGRTCVHRTHVRVGNAEEGAGVTVSEEDAAGNVNVLNTPNTWTSDTVAVTAAAAGQRVDLALVLFLSSQDPNGPVMTRQLRADATFGANDASAPAGVSVVLYDGLPRWCTVVTPVSSTTIDCSAAPILANLP